MGDAHSPMHTPLLVGVLTNFAVASVCLAALFVRAWWVRREHREYLVFGLLNASLAAHAASGAVYFAHAVGLPTGLTIAEIAVVATIPSKVAAALAFHFSLLFARVRRATYLALPVYGVMAAFVALGAGGGWWERFGEPQLYVVFGLTLHRSDVVPAVWARPFYWMMPLLVAVCVFVIARFFLQTRRGLGACLGAVALGVAVLNDLALGAGWFRTLPSFVLGALAFTYGVALTLISNYARTASELSASTGALQRRSEELERSYRELRRTQEELLRNEQLAVIGELAAVIAHEVRNPLAIVSNAVASLRKRRTTRDDRRTLLEIINEEMSRLDKLVGRLIHYARPVVIDKQAVDLEDVVARSAAVLEGSGCAVELERRGEIPTVTGDASLLRQVFENVFSNAMQASVGGRSIRVRLSRRNVAGVAVVAVEVTDEGEGMTPEEVASALTPFFTTRPTGTGLGLPIVARVVDAHGGQLQIDSEKGTGTTITIMLPLVWGQRLQPLQGGKRISLLP